VKARSYSSARNATELKREAEILARDIEKVQRLERKPRGSLVEILDWAKRYNVTRATRLLDELKQLYDEESRERECALARRMSLDRKIRDEWPQWMRDGKRWKDIAAELGIQVTTLKSRCQRTLTLKYRPVK
jgi:hypothetical protein